MNPTPISALGVWNPSLTNRQWISPSYPIAEPLQQMLLLEGWGSNLGCDTSRKRAKQNCLADPAQYFFLQVNSSVKTRQLSVAKVQN